MEQNLNISGKIIWMRQYSAIIQATNGMKVPGEKLGLDEKTLVDIIDVKADPTMIDMLIQTYGFLPGYHMNKRHWLTILLDGSVRDAQVLDFLDMSYDLIDGSK